MGTNEFHVGDRVQVPIEFDKNPKFCGMTGTVWEISGSMIGVIFDNWNDGHGFDNCSECDECGGPYRGTSGWYGWDCELELLQDYPNEVIDFGYINELEIDNQAYIDINFDDIF